MTLRSNNHMGSLAIGAALAMTATFPASAQQGVYVLDPVGQDACVMTGQAQLGLDYVFVNSSHPQAMTMGSSTVVLAPNIDVVGGVLFKGAFGGTLTTGVAAQADPLAAIPDPPWAPVLDLGKINPSSGELLFVSPGYYSGGARINSQATVIFQPGVYILDGEGLIAIAGSTIIGDGAVFYITGTGSLKIAGGTTVITMPPSNGPYKGICFFQDRANTNNAHIGGGGSTSIGGTIYTPSAQLTLSGGSEFGVDAAALGELIVTHQLIIKGKGAIAIGDNEFKLPAKIAYLLFD